MAKCIKGATLDGNRLGSGGYVILSDAATNSQEVRFCLNNSDHSDFSFVFGFRGVGNHFCLNFSARQSRYLLTRIQDGIAVYLQHAFVSPGQSGEVQISWSDHSIRLFAGGTCFVNILTDGLADGGWGFKGLGVPTTIPDVIVEIKERAKYEWLIVGDGYHNNRWRNRDFYSWPELAFGDKLNYLNACVAAGNTMRVLDIVEQISECFKGGSVIIAAGSDDVIEGHSIESIKSRITDIHEKICAHGARHVYVSTLPSKPLLGDACETLNKWILDQFSKGPDMPLDFNAILAALPDKGLIRNDHPTPAAHREIAKAVLNRFQMAAQIADLGYVGDSRRRGLLLRMRDKLAKKARNRLNRMLNVLD